MSPYAYAQKRAVDILSYYRIDPHMVLLDGVTEAGYYHLYDGWTKWRGVLPSDCRFLARMAEVMNRC
jgi:hypothetical protein